MEVFLVEIPKQNGKEQEGFRPAVLISKPNKNIAIIMPFTSNILALKFENTMKFEPNLENGLTSDSILLLFQIRAIDIKRLKKKIGIITKEEKLINSKLQNMLNL